MDIKSILQDNYLINDVIDITKDTDAANEVFYIKRANGEKLVYKIFTNDKAPSDKTISVIKILADEFNQIPRIIENVLKNDITSVEPSTKSILTTFQDGTIIDNVKLDSQILSTVVEIMASLHKLPCEIFDLKPWCLSTLRELGDFTDISKEIRLEKCTKGFIHGDLNHLNILIKNNSLSGIVDWDGLHNDYIATDLAIFIAHNVLKNDSHVSVKDVIREYSRFIDLSKDDMVLLRFLIELRIKQILTMLNKRLTSELDEKETIKKYVEHWESKNTLLESQKVEVFKTLNT